MAASWSFRIVDASGQFTDFNNGDAAQLECWFKRTGVSTGVIHLSNYGFAADVTSANVKTMEFNAQFATHPAQGWLRRVVPDAGCMLGAKFWNDTSFQDYSPQDSTQIIEAKKFGYATTAVFVNSVHYRISLHPYPIQTRVDTGMQRPVYIPIEPVIPIIDYPAVDENLYASFCLDGLPDALVEQIRCPITLTLMRQPVMAADGFTYEFEDIKKWLEKHDTSPATGGRLESKRLIINHAVRKMIAGMVAEQIRVVRKKKKQVEADQTDQTEPKKKKKKTPMEKAADAFAAANP